MQNEGHSGRFSHIHAYFGKFGHIQTDTDIIMIIHTYSRTI